MKKFFLAVALVAMCFALPACSDPEEVLPDEPEVEIPDDPSDDSVIKALVINESSSDNDFVEIYNGTDSDIDISGYFISDADTYDEDAYLFPESSVIKAGEFIAVYKDTDFAFGISSKGETVYLVDASGDTVDTIDLPAWESGYESYGRALDAGVEYTWFITMTDGASNTSIENNTGDPADEPDDPTVEPDENGVVKALVINESSSDTDFVEIYNGTDSDIDISGYFINDGSSYDEEAYLFQQGSTIKAGEFIAVFKGADFEFGISSSGETIYLVDANGDIVDTIDLPAWESGYESYGRKLDAGVEYTWFYTMTDGVSNTSIENNTGESGEGGGSTNPDSSEYPDWTTATHSNDVDPNFDIVFAQDKVLRIDLTISKTNWDAMWADLKANLGSTSSNPNMPGGGGLTTEVDFTPIFVPCTVSYDGKDWYEVGVRYKGNSSLSTAYSSGNEKLSMKLDFDEFEDDYPALKNQRFYGFKQLNLNNNYNDYSFMREKVAEDLFREFGMAAANTSFCEVYIDYGSGSQYFGLYTIVEEVDDTVIATQFINDSGNLYKPDGDAATFAYGTYDTEELYIKEGDSQFADTRALYDALHASNRISDQEAWKTQLESVFDVEAFMKWLAVTTTIQNWDVYGNMSHNYYIYNNPATSKLTWIPWDHNEAFQSGSGNMTSIEPSSLSRVSSSWPLISYLIAVDEYKEMYDDFLYEFTQNVFTTTKMTTTYSDYYTLLKTYVYNEVSGRSFLSYDSQFDSAVSTLKSHVQSRNTTVTNYLK
ncbi:MAG: CotH kinase family protein [Rikenellaceae bacterium]